MKRIKENKGDEEGKEEKNVMMMKGRSKKNDEKNE